MNRPVRSIRQKVALVVFGVISLSLALAAIGLGLYEYQAAESRLRTHLETLAESLLPIVAPAVDFEIPEAANEVLARIEGTPAVKAAWLLRYTAEGPPSVFARYERAGVKLTFTPSVRAEGFVVKGNSGLLTQVLRRDGREVAAMVIEGSLASARRGLGESLRVLGIIFVILLAVGALLSRVLGQSITEPITQLAATAREIRESGNYQLRVETDGGDEIGQLGLRLNDMLDGIEERDRRLAEAGAFNATVLDSTGVAIISTDTEGIVRAFNPAAEALLGYRADEIVGKVNPAVWHEPSEVAALAGELSARLAREVKVGFATFATSAELEPGQGREWTYLRKDGQRVPVYLVVSALRGQGGRIIGYCGLASDLSERKAAEAALRASEHRYSVVVDQTGQMVYDLDLATGRNLWFGAQAVETITGYTLEEFQSVTLNGWTELIHPEDREATMVEFDRCHAAGLRFDAVYRFRHKDGSYRVIQDFGVFLREDNGKVRMLGAMADVTERHQAEGAIRRLNTELEQRVAARTAELAQRVAEVERLNQEQSALMRSLTLSEQAADRAAARLQEANANLYSANQELEAFSYSVSHDLRAPLRNIAGFLELLTKRSDPVLDAESKRFVTVVNNEVARMGMLIDDLLTFARIGRTEMKREAVALGDVVKETQAELAQDLVGRVVEWKIDPLPMVRGDRVLLRQVMVNLLSNAIKFTRRRPAALIEVEVGPTRPEDRMVTLVVRDNGAGFNPKYIGKLFGVFQRLHNGRDFEGTGIGLANVKRIVTRHGGRIWAEGNVDKGAAFYLTLPLYQSNSHAEADKNTAGG